MRIEYVHASRYGNGATVADAFRRHADAAEATVHVHHVGDVDPAALPPADLYVFSSPGRFGRPIGSMRRFLRRTMLPPGTRCAIVTTEIPPPDDGVPDDPAGGTGPSDHQRVRSTMEDLLRAAGLVTVAEATVFVTGKKGPLVDGWEATVARFAADVLGRAEDSRPAVDTPAPQRG